MNMKLNLLFLSVIVYIRINLVSCLRCHVCSTANPGEEDCVAIAAAETKYLLDCEPPYDVSCRIQQQWVDFEVVKQKSDRRTIRQCASTPFDEARPCYYRTGFGAKTNVCNCDQDGCNAAVTLYSTSYAVAASLAVLLALKIKALF